VTFTYSDTDLTTDLAKVRLRIGDTDSDDPLLTDEEIQVSLDATSTNAGASVACVKRILALLARDIDRNGTRFSGSRSQKTQHYRDLLAELQDEAGEDLTSVAEWSEMSQADDTSIESNSDFRPPRFTVGQDEY